MLKLNCLFEGESESAVIYFRGKDTQKAFEQIIEIRQMLFDNEPFLEIIRKMMEIGIIPYSVGIPGYMCDFSYIYDRLSKAEVRLMQVKNFLIEESRRNGMSAWEKACEAARVGGHSIVLSTPNWNI